MDCNILVIDDEPHIPESVSRALHGDGFTVFTANSGAEALAVLDRHPIDVVLSERDSRPMDRICFPRSPSCIHAPSVSHQ